MPEKTDEMRLIQTALAELTERVLPQLSGSARYSGLMIANALAISNRAAGSAPDEPTPFPDQEQLCMQIRRGVYDPDQPGHASFMDWLRFKTDRNLAICNPKVLEKHQKQAANESPST